MEVYRVLCGEPWCFHVEEVNRLTDFQIWELYLKPAIKRDRRSGGQKYGEGSRWEPRQFQETDAEGKPVSDRQRYIDIGVALGGNAEHWGKEYDKWALSAEGKRTIARWQKKRQKRK